MTALEQPDDGILAVLSGSDAADALTLLRTGGYAFFSIDLETGRLLWSADAARVLNRLQDKLPLDLDTLTADGGGDQAASRRAFFERARRRELAPQARQTFTVSRSAMDGDAWFEDRLMFFSGVAAMGTADRIVGSIHSCPPPTKQVERREAPALVKRHDREWLTGQLTKAIEHASAAGTTVTYAAICLDNLDRINQAYGFEAANEAIEAARQCVDKAFREGDYVGWLGGSMFGAVLSGVDGESIQPIVERLQAALRRDVIDTSAGPLAITLSVGAVVMPEQASSAVEAMIGAEDALSQGRARGADVFTLYSPDIELQAKRRRNFSVAADIVSALENDRIRLAYQPVVDAQDHSRVVFSECLVRMLDQDGAPVPAGLFMPVAETLGIVRLVDRCVLSQTFDTLKLAPNARLSVNISPSTVSDQSWREVFDHNAGGRRDLTERLIVEITEAAEIEDMAKTLDFIEYVRSHGCAIAIDDFGAGYTSFQNFRDLSVDMLKIDGSFIRGITESADNQLFVSALLAIAKNFDILTVAEFVETQEEAALLAEMGVDCLQGYHFSKPLMKPDWLFGASE